MDSDKEVNLSGKNLTPFSIADILSGSSKASADNPPAPPTPPPSQHPLPAAVANVHQPSYPWFLFNPHPPCWPLMLPEASAQTGSGSTTGNNGQADLSNSSALTTVSSSPEDDDLDRLSDDDELFDQDDDDDGSLIGSLISSTDDGQQEDALDMRASHRQHRRRHRTRKSSKKTICLNFSQKCLKRFDFVNADF
jgi:hypothetical protein